MTKRTVVKKAAKRVTSKLKPGPKPMDLTERMATRFTPTEKLHIEKLAFADDRRTVSSYMRKVIVQHLQENPPPE